VLGPSALKEPIESLNLEHALKELIDQNREEIVSTLMKHFGSESSMFTSLWNASNGAEIEEPEENNSVVQNEVTPQKMRAFEWIVEGNASASLNTVLAQSSDSPTLMLIDDHWRTAPHCPEILDVGSLSSGQFAAAGCKQTIV
jgi:hypothetical protein